VTDLVFERVAGQTLMGDLYMPAGGGTYPAIVMMHGGGYTGGTRQWLRQEAIFFAQNGYVGFTIDYRLAPEFHYPAPVDDGKAAVEFLRQHASQYHVDAKRIGMLGTSAGVTMVADIGAAGRGSTGWKVGAVAGWSGVWFVYDAFKMEDRPL